MRNINKLAISVMMSVGLTIGSAHAQESTLTNVVDSIQSLSPETRDEVLSQILKLVSNKEQTSQVSNPVKSETVVVEAQTDALITTQDADQAVSVATNVVDYGKAFGVAISEAAKGIGVATADFFDSGIGILLGIVIFIKMVGSFVLQVLFGTMFLITGVILVKFFARRMVHETIEYNEEVRNIFGNHPIVKYDRGSLSSDASFGVFAMIFAVLGMSAWLFIS